MTNIASITQRCIEPGATLIEALKLMDRLEVKSLLVLKDGDVFVGVLSIGDIQRALIRNISMDNLVLTVLRPNPRIAREETPKELIMNEMLLHRMEFMPIIDDTDKIIGLYLWEELFLNRKFPPLNQFDLPVVIMAGGKGTRLRPLTNVIPKPLIPIGKRTIIEEIFHRFARHGSSRFYITVNYKAELLEYYLKELNLEYRIEFFREDTPLGTAGSLSLLKNSINQTFFVSNCDIIIDQDYSEILEYHKSNANELTIVAALKHYPIPYGIIETGDNGILKSLIEKPELTFKINSGMYLLEPDLLHDIPENRFFHITDLIQQINARNGKVGVFPISEKSWNDIGEWDVYLKNSITTIS